MNFLKLKFKLSKKIFILIFTFEMILNLVHYSSKARFEISRRDIRLEMRKIFLAEAEKLPCNQASLTLGTRCLMISNRPITPCAPGSKQWGTPGDETEQVVVLNLVPRRIINCVFVWLLARFHSFKCLLENWNPKTVNDRIYERIGQTKHGKNVIYN